MIISKENINDDQKVDEFQFEANTVYALDIMMSSGEGREDILSSIVKRNF